MKGDDLEARQAKQELRRPQKKLVLFGLSGVTMNCGREGTNCLCCSCTLQRVPGVSGRGWGELEIKSRSCGGGRIIPISPPPPFKGRKERVLVNVEAIEGRKGRKRGKDQRWLFDRSLLTSTLGYIRQCLS